MLRKTLLFLMFALFVSPLLAQFGKNKVQYKDFTWYFIQTKHFDIYFPQQGEKIAEFAAKEIEDALQSVQKTLDYTINNRMTIIVYKSLNDFQETNVTDEYLEEGIGGFTEIFKNRIVVPFDGSYRDFRHVIHHELVHGVINDMFYGGSLQNVISKNISIQVPLWFNEGLAEYEALGWDTNTDMFIRDAIINEYLPDLNYLNGYFAYRGGQSVFYYIANKYGKEKIGEIVNKTKGLGNLEDALKSSIGLNFEELNERWKKDLKKVFWPDIAKRDDPDVYSKRMTNHKKEGGSYNTSPAISPQGDKIAFLSNRNFYFDVYIMDAVTGKIIKKLVEGNTTNQFEQLNILTPGLDWSPDGKKIALSAKSSGYDVIYIIDVEEEEEEQLPIKFGGVATVSWSPDGKYLTFIGHDGVQSDVYVYDLEAHKAIKITDDIFSEADPRWAADGKKIYFSSDRQEFVDPSDVPEGFDISRFDYSQLDLYSIDIATKEITRLTNTPRSNETSVIASPDNRELLFVSDLNGINNIYRKRLYLTESDSVKNIVNLSAEPVTNSLNGIYQLSISADGKKLVFSSMYESAYDIFLLSNPFEIKLGKAVLEPTLYFADMLNNQGTESKPDFLARVTDTEKVFKNKDTAETEPETASNPTIFTGKIEEDSTENPDSTKKDYSRYVFGRDTAGSDTTSMQEKKEFEVRDNLDSNGNFVVNKYKINFSPDIIYANAGYSTLYGLLGTTVLSFSDMLGNHRIVGVTSLQIDLKNSDYGLAYYYLPERTDFGIEGFHTARFVLLDRGFETNLFRFRNYGTVLSASYPLSKFYRFDAGLAWLNVSSENLDNIDERTDKVSYLIPSVSFVHDNVLWGYFSPIDGTRYNLTAFGNPISGKNKLSFYSVTWDYRHYARYWYDHSFVFRFSGGYSGGANPQRFFIGGTENWINRTFSTGEIPLESASDFAFLTPGLPLRGYDYAEQIGTKYALMNIELRMPLIRYLVTGPIPLLFQNILGAAFIDMGSAWNDTKKLQFIGKVGDDTRTKDLLVGTGFGARLYFLYFLLRFDVAWTYDLDSFSRPKYYISLGADF